MAYNYEYPYVDSEHYNADWILGEIKRLVKEWDGIEKSFVDLKKYVTDYFKNLDVSEEISDKLDEMYDDGRIADAIDEALLSLKYITTTNKKIAFFGDSWTYGNGVSTEDRFSSVVGNKLGMQVYNYGVGGSGFVKPAPNGETMIDTLNRIHDESEIEYDIIVVMGGFNDVNHLIMGDLETSLYSIYTAGQTYLNRLCQLYPNSKIVWCGLNLRCHDLHPYFRSEYDYMNNIPTVTSTSNPIIKVTDWQWQLVGQESYYNNDKVHPNVTGHNIIANSIIQALLGGQNNYRIMGQLITGGNMFPSAPLESNTQLYVELINDKVTVHFPIFEFASDWADTETVRESSIVIPQRYRPRSPIIVPAYSGNNTFTVDLLILGDGTIYCRKQTGTTIKGNAKIYASDITYDLYAPA